MSSEADVPNANNDCNNIHVDTSGGGGGGGDIKDGGPGDGGGDSGGGGGGGGGSDLKLGWMDSIPFDRGVDVSPKKDGGILKLVERPGCSTTCPLFGDVVYLNYVVCLEDGLQVVDQRSDEEQPYSFTVGQAEVILAWEFAIPTMKEGEVSTLRCSPEYAYGDDGRPPVVPPKATIVCRVKLLRWHGRDISDDGDGSIYASLIESGETYGMPNEGALCTVELVGRYKGGVFDERVVTFNLGEGSEYGIVAGIEQALLRFSRKEKARIKIKSHVAYGSEGCVERGIPPGADLEYDLHLLDCVRAKDFWDMTTEEKLAQSLKDKQKGLHYFQEGNLRQAKRFFEKVIEYLQFQELCADYDSSTRQNLLVTSHMNLALCHLREDNPHEAHGACTRALELDPSNEKCLYRRSMASMKMKDFRGAVEDLSRMVAANPTNKVARRQLTLAQGHLKDALVRERDAYRGLFQKSTTGRISSDP